LAIEYAGVQVIMQAVTVPGFGCLAEFSKETIPPLPLPSEETNT